ncbi:hypothetical protein D3C72_1882840 [compost metagenome]
MVALGMASKRLRYCSWLASWVTEVTTQSMFSVASSWPLRVNQCPGTSQRQSLSPMKRFSWLRSPSTRCLARASPLALAV